MAKPICAKCRKNIYPIEPVFRQGKHWHPKCAPRSKGMTRPPADKMMRRGHTK